MSDARAKFTVEVTVDPSDSLGPYIVSVCVDRGVERAYRWYLTCPRCKESRIGLLGTAHDFGADCPSCRHQRSMGGSTGPTGARKVHGGRT